MNSKRLRTYVSVLLSFLITLSLPGDLIFATSEITETATSMSDTYTTSESDPVDETYTLLEETGLPISSMTIDGTSTSSIDVTDNTTLTLTEMSSSEETSSEGTSSGPTSSEIGTLPDESTASESAKSESTSSEMTSAETTTPESITVDTNPEVDHDGSIAESRTEAGNFTYSVKELRQIDYLDVQTLPDLATDNITTLEVAEHPAFGEMRLLDENGQHVLRIYINGDYFVDASDDEVITLNYELTYADHFEGSATIEVTLHETEAKTTVLASEDVTPYQDIILSHTNENAFEPVQTYEAMIMMVSVNGAPMSQQLNNAYIDVTVPLKDVDLFTVPTAPSIESSRDIKDVENNLWTKRIYLQDITVVTKFDFPVNFSFANSMVREGTVLKPRVEIFTAEDPVTGEGMLIKTAVDNTSFSVKYFPWRVTKSGPLGGGDYNFQTAGVDTNGDNVYDRVFDVDYTFPIRITTTYSHGVRFIEKAYITDTLPTCKAGPGGAEIRTATFDPAKNPGWVLSDDETTVSTELTIPTVGGGLTDLSTKLTLTLSFPDLYLDKSLASVGGYQDVTNSTTVSLIPFGYDPSYPEPITTTPISDKVILRMIGTINTSGMASKRFHSNATDARYPNSDFLDKNQMHKARQTSYSIDVTNKTSFPITNFVIRDAEMDPRLYLRSVKFQKVTSGPTLMDFDLYGITADGTEEKLDHTQLNEYGNSWGEKETYDILLSQAEAWEADMSQPMPQGLSARKYVTYELRLQEGKSLIPGERLLFYWYVNYLRPYQLSTSEPSFTNRFSVHGDSVFGEETVPLEVQSNQISHKLIDFPASMHMRKVTRNNDTGHLSSTPQFDLILHLAKSPKGTVLRDGKFVDLLPPGFDFTRLIPRASSSGIVDFANYTLTEDYQGTGRTLLEVPLLDPEIMVRELPDEIEFTVEAKITEFAYNTSLSGELDDNHRNFTYFTTSDMTHLPGETLQHSDYTSPQVITIDGTRFGRNTETYPFLQDKFDIDNDGNTQEYLVGAESPVIVTLPREIRGQKAIRNNPDVPWVRTGIETAYSDTFQYRLRIMNNGTVVLTYINLFDRLPHIGDLDSFSPDHGKSYPARNSGWQITLRNAITAPAGYTVFYSTSNLSNVVQEALDSEGWMTADQISDWSQVTAINVKSDEGTVLHPSHAVDFILDVQAPSYVKGRTFPFDRANNNFVVSYDEESLVWGQSNTVYHKLLKSFAVKKEWEGPAADAVQVSLLQNGVPYQVDLDGDGIKEPWTVKLTESAEWYQEFYNLPAVDANGRGYTYTVAETAVQVYERDENGTILTDGDGNPIILREDSINEATYTPTIDGTMVIGFTVTNTYVSPKHPIKADLTWLNGEEAPTKPNVTFTLKVKTPTGNYEDVLNAAGNPVTLTISSDAAFTDGLNFGEQPVFDAETGEALTYSIVQTGLDESTWVEQSISEVTPANIDGQILSAQIFGPDADVTEDTLHVVNEYRSPLIDVTAQKVYINGSPDDYELVYLQLYRGLNQEEPVIVQDDVDPPANLAPNQVTATETPGTYEAIWQDMPETDESGRPYIYSVKEVNASGADYSVPNYVKSGEGTLTVTNTYVSPKINLTAEKKWIEGPEPPASIEIALYRTVDGGSYEEVTRATLEKAQDWTHEFTELDETDIHANTYSYNVRELALPKNYTASYSSDGLMITNTFMPPIADLTADTEWVNGENFQKPGTTLSLKVETIDELGNSMFIDATDIDGNSITGVVGTDGIVTFANVPLTDINGISLNYTVTQTGLEGTPWELDSISIITPYGADGEVDPTQTNIHVVNYYTSPTIDLTADTEWINGDEVAKPETELSLMVKDPVSSTWIPATDNEGNPITGTADIDGVWTYPEVPLTGKDGTPLVYSVIQTGLEGTLWYERSVTEIQPQADDGTLGETNVHVINEYDPATINLTASTLWLNGKAIQKPTTTLSLKVKDPTIGEWIDATDKDGNPIVGQQHANGLWTFPDVPLTNEQGTALSYTVVQSDLSGSVWLNDYITEITPQNADLTIGETHIQVVNSYQVPMVPITAANEWKGGPNIDSSTFVTYTLTRSITIDGLMTTEEVVVNITPNQDGSFDFGSLPTTDEAGNPYTYSVVQKFTDPDSETQYETVITSITPSVNPQNLNIEIVNTFIEDPPTTTEPTTTEPTTTEPTTSESTVTEPTTTDSTTVPSTTVQPSATSGTPVARTGEHMMAPWIAAGSFLLAAVLFLLRKFRNEEELENSGN